MQAADSALDQVAHRRATLPAATRLAEVEVSLESLDSEIVRAETDVSDIERESRKADADVEQVRERSARDSQRMDSGLITNAKELESIQHEITSLARRQAELEDVELEILERLESAQGLVTTLHGRRESEQIERDELIAARDEAYARFDEEAAKLRTERDESATGIPDELMALYEKLRKSNSGVGAARLHQGRCEGCRLEITASELGKIRDADPTEVVRCEECRRILVRTNESGL